jgi:hypothetical protein
VVGSESSAAGMEQAEAAAAGSEAGDYSDDNYDMAEEGACSICYSLHLPDPAHPDQIGKHCSHMCAPVACAFCCSCACDA